MLSQRYSYIVTQLFIRKLLFDMKICCKKYLGPEMFSISVYTPLTVGLALDESNLNPYFAVSVPDHDVPT